jgi:DNA end-binding protein Ku
MPAPIVDPPLGGEAFRRVRTFLQSHVLPGSVGPKPGYPALMPRPTWSRTISFGLVSVPVKMYSATESKELRFHFLHKDDLEPIGYDKVRKDTGERVDPDKIVRGFEVEKGRYVELTEEDLDRLDIELTHSIDICDFVDIDEIDPIYFRKAYYLLPEEGAERPYRLLLAALEETGTVGIAKVVIRNKQHLAALRPWEGVLLLETMYFADEIRKPEPVDGKVELRKPEIEMARSLVENLSDAFDPEKYDDTYRKELLALLKEKAETGEISPPREEGEEKGEVIDLLAALRESVERTKQQRKRSTTRKRKAS